MHDQPTTTSPSASCGNCNGCNSQPTPAESNSVGKCKAVCGTSPGRACGNAEDADRRNAIQRQKILDKALIFAAKLRKHDYAVEVTDAWEQFTDAVDELVAGKC